MALTIREWYDRATGAGGGLTRAKKHIEASVNIVRGGGEAAITGAALGALDCALPNGLDIPVDKAGKFQMPADALVAVAGLAGGVALAHEEYGTDLRNVGMSAMSVFSFRKARDFTALKMREKGKTPGYQTSASYHSAATGTKAAAHGEFAGEMTGGEDPIVAAGRLL
jgi:hypothetical protein